MVAPTAARAQRHNPGSIASLRLAVARGLLRRLVRCPLCGGCPRPPPKVTQ